MHLGQSVVRGKVAPRACLASDGCVKKKSWGEDKVRWGGDSWTLYLDCTPCSSQSCGPFKHLLVAGLECLGLVLVPTIFPNTQGTKQGERFAALSGDRPQVWSLGIGFLMSTCTQVIPKGPFCHMADHEAPRFKCLYHKGVTHLHLELHIFRTCSVSIQILMHCKFMILYVSLLG